ncbi:MAG: RIP metalloprotease RseP [Muribaculaceae bacterium]|nr:RIP metalloprotease RseP [Muribaculaceae bacterium]
METFLIKALQLIAALALLVVIHEAGHYMFARIFGIKVEKFYLFFDPWFALLRWRPKKKKVQTPRLNSDGTERASWRDTEYGIGWLPLGGYVKIAGMIDESMDRDQMAKPAQPWEFRSKAAHKRLLVMLGGVIMNFVLAIIIYAGIAFYWGERTIDYHDAYAGLDYSPAALKAGFVNGDIPLTADGEPIVSTDRDHILKMVQAHEVTVLRGGSDTVTISLPSDFVFQVSDDGGFCALRVPVFVKMVQAGDPAAKAGILEGDHIVAVGGVPTPSFTEFSPRLRSHASDSVTITVERAGGETLDLTVVPTSEGTIGIGLMKPDEVYPVKSIRYSILASVPKGIAIGTGTLGSYVSSLRHVFSKRGAESIGGFGAIGNMFPSAWNWRTFWETTAFLSIILAFMNILPIPALDGGHVLFLFWEIITRRKPSEKVLEYAQMAGMAFLFAILLYANGNDIYRFFFK